MSDEAFDAVTSASYDLATGDASLSDLPELLAQAMGYGTGLLSLRRGLVPIELATNLPSEIIKPYVEHYFRLDPWTQQIESTPFGHVTHSIWSENRSAFENTEFYQDFARRQGLIEPLGVRLQISGETQLQVGVNQRRLSGDPSPAEIERILRLGKHLSRGLQLRQRFIGLEEAQTLSLAVLDRLTFGMAVLDDQLRIHMLNAAAESVFSTRSGLDLRHGRVQATHAPDQPVFRRLVADVGAGGAGGSLLLHDEAGEPTLFALISPVPPRLPSAGTGVLLVLSEPRQGTALNRRILSDLFALSAAEMAVAGGLAAGRSLDELATLRGVKPSTLKTQLESIFAKTGVDSQRELVLLLGRLPRLR